MSLCHCHTFKAKITWRSQGKFHCQGKDWHSQSRSNKVLPNKVRQMKFCQIKFAKLSFSYSKKKIRVSPRKKKFSQKHKFCPMFRYLRCNFIHLLSQWRTWQSQAKDWNSQWSLAKWSLPNKVSPNEVRQKWSFAKWSSHCQKKKSFAP